MGVCGDSPVKCFMEKTMYAVTVDGDGLKMVLVNVWMYGCIACIEYVTRLWLLIH